ncbi:MAG: hypothetical protein LBU51_08680 [Bacteroidales bacterium]|jgi:uncharacterized protein (TIGR02145 family)|nr:hypothetical protein [Bacteroidales bacterium]
MKTHNYSRFLIIISIFFFGVMMVSSYGYAADRFVRPSGTAAVTAGANTWENACRDLQAVINASAAGDNIYVAAGTYIPNRAADDLNTINTGNRNNAFVLKAGVKIYGGFPTTNTNYSITGRNITTYLTILSGDLGGVGRCYHVVIGAGSTTTNMTTATLLDGFTIRAGNANGTGSITVNTRSITQGSGGGILLYYGNITMENLTITANNGTNAAGIYSAGANFIMTNSTVSANDATTNGGGIYFNTGTPQLTNVTINNNTSMNNGGGLLINASSPQMTLVTIDSNQSNCGGGIFITGIDSKPFLKQVTVSDNTANTPGGGGIYNYTNATLTFMHGKIIGNKTTNASGGGLYNNIAKANIINSIISGNRANGAFVGGGIYNTGASTLNLVNVTVAGNTALANGGGIHNANTAILNMENTIVWGNFESKAVTQNYKGTDVYNGGTTTGTGSISYKNSLVRIENDGNTAINDLGNNLSIDPLFVAPITSFAATPTVAGDYRLQDISPANNGGDSSLYKTALGANFLGWTLEKDVDNLDRQNSGKIDIGAYEQQIPKLITPDANGIVYVDHTKVGDGSSWSLAYPNLAVPLLQAQSNKDITAIYVAEGSYYPMFLPASSTISAEIVRDNDKTFLLVKDVKVYGGFATGLPNVTDAAMAASQLENRVFAAHETILSGDLLQNDSNMWDVATLPLDKRGAIYPDWSTLLSWGATRSENAHHVVVAAGDLGDACLDGFTISDGFACEIKASGESNQPYNRYSLSINGKAVQRPSGGGIFLAQTSLDCKNLIVKNNAQQLSQQAASIVGFGGGIYADGSTLNLSKSLITNNLAARAGGGLSAFALMDDTRIILDSVQVTHNGGWREGSGLHFAEIPTGTAGYHPLYASINHSDISYNRQLHDYNNNGSLGADGGAIAWSGGNRYGGAGAAPTATASAMYIKNSKINHNEAAMAAGISSIYARYVEIDSCEILNNSTLAYTVAAVVYGYGGAMYANGGSTVTPGRGEVVINHSIIANNRAITYAGGIYFRNTIPSVTNCRIIGNQAANIPSIYQENATNVSSGGKYINCLFADNSFTSVAADQQAFSFDAGTATTNPTAPSFANCTFAENQLSDAQNMFAIWLDPPASTPVFYNCIMTKNAKGRFTRGTGINRSIFKNCLTNFPVGTFGTNGANANNFENEDPQYFDPATGNYTLQEASPAIDAGDTILYRATRAADFTNYLTEIDLNDRLRVQQQIDMGAFEFFVLGCDSVTDFDGNVYHSIHIDTLCWFTTNLRALHYDDGAVIPIAKVYDNDDAANLDLFGRLYDWNSATRNGEASHQGACPAGWRLPFIHEYEYLISTYGANGLKAIAPGWWGDEPTITDSSHLSIPPAGYYDKSVDNYYLITKFAYLWTNELTIGEKGKVLVLIQDCEEPYIIDFKKAMGVSVRCVRKF